MARNGWDYLFGFDSPAQARNFVHRLALNLEHLAIFIADEHVWIMDGADEDRHDRIMGLAKTSSATLASPLIPKKPSV